MDMDRADVGLTLHDASVPAPKETLEGLTGWEVVRRVAAKRSEVRARAGVGGMG